MLCLRLPATQFQCSFSLNTRGGLPRRFLPPTLLKAFTRGPSHKEMPSLSMQKKVSAGSTGSVWASSSKSAFYKVRVPSLLMIRGQDYGNVVMIWMDLSWRMRHFYLHLIATGCLKNSNRSFSLFCSKFWLWLQFIPITCSFHAGKIRFSFVFTDLSCSVLRGAVCSARLATLYGHPAFEQSADWRVMEPVNLKKKRGGARLLC